MLRRPSWKFKDLTMNYFFLILVNTDLFFQILGLFEPFI